MRAVVGGLVTQVEAWNYVDKQTGKTVEMQSVFILSGKTVDKLAVPVEVGVIEPGSEQWFVADVSISRRKGNQGGEFVDLSAWVRHLYAYEGDPTVKADPANGLQAVN